MMIINQNSIGFHSIFEDYSASSKLHNIKIASLPRMTAHTTGFFRQTINSLSCKDLVHLILPQEIDTLETEIYFKNRIFSRNKIAFNLEKFALSWLQDFDRKLFSWKKITSLEIANLQKPQAVFLLTANVMQYTNSLVWKNLSSEEKLAFRDETASIFKTHFSLTLDQVTQVNILNKTYLSLNNIEHYRNTLLIDQGMTSDWIQTKNRSVLHLIKQNQNPVYNCVAHTIGIQNQWIWHNINDQDFWTPDQLQHFYAQYDYIQNIGELDFNRPNSIIAFGHCFQNGQIKLKHVGKINQHGLYSSKQGSAGSVFWLSPELDSSLEYGTPLIQFFQNEFNTEIF